MMLLQTSTLQLVDKRGDNIPPYAILSHTWGEDDEEISLQDLKQVLAARQNKSNDPLTQSIVARPGFIKIRDAAKLASSEGYDFIWIDTCCIDKTSSAELSEAINSMFRWYEQSAVCYVFLSDVETIEDPAVRTRQLLPPKTCEAICKSRWFTRGWTLQELIAPSNLRFYSKGWVFLATKDGHFTTYLSTTTGIDTSALLGLQELEYFSVATRMQWASQRKTTRVEDMAYSLMGIFNVNMPLLYGEGNKAFIRLQEEILKGNNDQSLFAWRCPKEDPLSGQLSGLLAKTPVWFRHSQQFRPLPTNVEGSPSSMTNAGLHVQFRLYSPHNPSSQSKKGQTGTNEDVVAVLHCSPYTCEDRQVKTIRKAALRLAHLGGDRYSRLNCDTIIDIDPFKLEFAPSTHEYIYVKQNPTIELPDMYVDDRMMNHELLSVWFPKGQWDESTKTLRCNKPGRGGILGVFRYSLQRPGTRGSLVDVLVGIQPRSQRLETSGYWCFHHIASHDESLGARSPPADIDLSTVHRHNNIWASVKLQRKDQIHNELTLELRQVRPFLLPMDENYFYMVPAVPRILESPEKHGQIRYWLSVLTQPELITTGKFETDFIRADIIPALRGSKRAAAIKTGLQTLQSEVKIDLPAPDIDSEVSSSGGSNNRAISLLTGYRASRNKEISRQHKQDIETMRSLIRACLDGDYKTVNRELCQYNDDIERLLEIPTLLSNFDVASDFRLLHWAVAGGNREIVRALLRSDSEPGTRFQRDSSRDWLTTLHVATIMGNVPIMKDLIEGSEELWATILRPALSHCESFDHPRDSLMHLAASYIHSQEVEEAFTCLRMVQQNNSEDGSNWVNADRNGLGETPLHRAAAMNNTHAVSAILARLSNVQDLECLDNRKRSPLWHAAAADAYDALLMLLNRGADAHTQDELGIAALHAACRSARSEVVQALLSHGADPNVCTIIDSRSRESSTVPRSTCMTPCMYAALRGNATTLCALLAAGSKVDGPQGSDLTPIHIAAANGHLDFIKVLCAKDGVQHLLSARTPYWVRIQDRKPQVLELKIFPKGGEVTALELARLSGKDEVVSYLESL